ncbi:MAG: class IV adenylate cyclase [Candidatus Helarchaeota archaeon]
MIEVELKVPIADKNMIAGELKKIGFVFKKSIIQNDTYFQHPIRDFAKTDEALRIRETPEEVFLSYKGPKLDEITKTREEIEISFDNSKNLKKIFEKIGFKKVIVINKTRELFEMDEIKAAIDIVEHLGAFLELEILCENKETMPDKRETLFSILKKINISQNSIIRKSYLELLLKI